MKKPLPRPSAEGRAHSANWSRRAFIGLSAASLAVMTSGAWARWLEPGWLQASTRDVTLRDLPPEWDGLKVAHLSDFHYGDLVPEALVRQAIDQAVSWDPDLVALTGDYTDTGGPGNEAFCELLKPLSAGRPTLAVMGNHDFFHSPRGLYEAMTNSGIRVLRNEIWTWEHRGAALRVAGMDTSLFRFHRPKVIQRKLGSSRCDLLLLHEPDTFDELGELNARLQLSGHSHGGQVCVPGWGPIVLPALAKRYVEGLHEVEGRQLHVTRGVGMTGLAMRFACPPEVNLLTLRSA